MKSIKQEEDTVYKTWLRKFHNNNSLCCDIRHIIHTTEESKIMYTEITELLQHALNKLEIIDDELRRQKPNLIRKTKR